MGACLGAHSHSVVVDDDRSMNNTTGAPRGSTARPVRESEPVRSTAQTESEPPRQRADRPDRETAQSEEQLEESARPVRTNRLVREPKRENEPPLFVPFYIPRMQISRSKGLVGGATLAHWSGEKEACISPDPDICTRGSAIFP